MRLPTLTAYQDIQRRVADAEDKAPSPLRAELTDLFINHPAVKPHDGCPPATAKMIRYRLANGWSLGHQIGTRPQHVWLAAASLPLSLPSGIARADYPATEGGKGRHSNVNQMPDLRDQAVVRLTVTSLDQAERLLNAMLTK